MHSSCGKSSVVSCDCTSDLRCEAHLTPSNLHRMIDILYLGRIFPKRCAVMAKRELKWSPFLGQLYV